MNPEEVQKVIERLKELQKYDDYENSHHEADGIICDCLSKLGFNEIVFSIEFITNKCLIINNDLIIFFLF